MMLSILTLWQNSSTCRPHCSERLARGSCGLVALTVLIHADVCRCQAPEAVSRPQDERLDDVEHLHAVAEEQHLQAEPEMRASLQQLWPHGAGCIKTE